MNPQEKWNLKYTERIADEAEREPNQRLLRLDDYLKGGKAIDIAAGLGANSFYLANKQYDVTAVDISDIAIKYIHEQAAAQRLNITALTADITKDLWPIKKCKYDLAVITYYLDRSLFPVIKEVINDQGYLFVETFYKTRADNERKVSDHFKLESNELLKEFKEWKILFFEENEQEGRQTVFCQKQIGK